MQRRTNTIVRELADRLDVQAGDSPEAFHRAWKARMALVEIGLPVMGEMVRLFNETKLPHPRMDACGVIAAIAKLNRNSEGLLPAAEAMAEGLGDDDYTVRNRCATALAAMGPGCIPELVKSYSSPRTGRMAKDKIYAVICKIARDSRDADAVDFVIDNAKNEANPGSQAFVIGAMAEIGLPRLLDSLGSEDQQARISAVRMIAKIVRARSVDVRAVLGARQIDGEVVEPPARFLRLNGRPAASAATTKKGRAGHRGL